MKPPFKPLRRPFSYAVAVALIAVVGALVPSSGAARQASSSPLVIDMPVGPATLDPAEECGFTDITVSMAVYSRLTRYGSTPGPNGTTQVDPGHMVPYLAKSWDISKNGLVYTFHLRSGVKFADGQPVDSAAVKYSLERSVTMGGCGGYFIYDGIYTPPLIKSITTPDPLTAVITLSVPDANVLQDWAQPAASIVDEKLISAHGGVQKGKVNTWMAGNVTPGAGPYLLQSYEPNKQAVFTANPNFFDQPASSKVIVNFVSSDPTLVLQAKNGTADVTLGLSKQSAHSLASDSEPEGRREQHVDRRADRAPERQAAVQQREVPRGPFVRGSLPADPVQRHLRLRHALLRRLPAGDARVPGEPRAAAEPTT